MAETHTLATSLEVNVVTPLGTVTSVIEANRVTAPGELGEFEVLPGHIPFLTSLYPGVLVIGAESGAEILAVSRGYLRVDQDGKVEVLVERAVPGSKVNADAANKAHKEATDELDGWKTKPLDGDWRNLKDRHAWAQAQIEAHKRS